MVYYKNYFVNSQNSIGKLLFQRDDNKFYILENVSKKDAYSYGRQNYFESKSSNDLFSHNQALEMLNLRLKEKENKLKELEIAMSSGKDTAKYEARHNEIIMQIGNAKINLNNQDMTGDEGFLKAQNIIKSVKELEKALKHLESKKDRYVNEYSEEYRNQINSIKREINELKEQIKNVDTNVN